MRGLVADRTRLDVPARRRRDEAPRAVSHVGDDLTRPRGVGVDRLAELPQVLPRVVPAVLRVRGVGVAEHVRQAHEEGAAGPGVRGARVPELARVGLGPREQLVGSRGHVGDDLGVVLQQRSGRVVRRDRAEVACELLHRGCGLDVVGHVREPVTVVGDDRDPQPLADTGGQSVVARHDEVDGQVARVHLRLDRADEVWRPGALPRHRGDDLGVGLDEGVDHGPGELLVARDVKDVERDRRRRRLGDLLRVGCGLGGVATARRAGVRGGWSAARGQDEPHTGKAGDQGQVLGSAHVFLFSGGPGQHRPGSSRWCT